MVIFIPDPQNPVNYIPRFEDPQEMGDYWEEKGFKGKCAVSAEIIPSTAIPGERYMHAYQKKSPIAWIPLIVGLIIIAIFLYVVTYFIMSILGALTTLFSSPKAEVKELNGLAVISCPDGSTFGVDKDTKQIIWGETCEAVDPPGAGLIELAIIGTVVLVVGILAIKFVPEIKQAFKGGVKQAGRVAKKL